MISNLAQNLSLDGMNYIFINSLKMTTELLYMPRDTRSLFTMHLTDVASSALVGSKYCLFFWFMSNYNLQAWPDSHLTYNVSFQMYPWIFMGLSIMKKLVCDMPTF